jgi:putative ABC transport system permease protein
MVFEIIEGLRIALSAIRANKLRTLLTTLGIIIGIVSVTAMATVVSGIEGGFEADMASLGTDILYVERMPWIQGPGSKWWEYRNRPRMTADVAESITKRARSVEAITTVVRTFRSASYQDRHMAGVRLAGVSYTFPEVFEVDLQDGSFFSDMDERAARNVAVIGSAVAEGLFTVEDPIGKHIRVAGARYRVIGIMEKKGQGAEGGSFEDFQVKIPFKSFSNSFGTRYRDVSVQVKIADNVDIEDAKDELTGIVRVARRLDAKDADNFDINESGSIRAAVEPVKAAIYAIGIGLTGLSLLVGGIGVMNIMFVSVKERTREIGIRKAVGAKQRTILLQFLIEAVAVSLLGGAVGVMLSFPFFLLVKSFLPAEFSLGTVMLAFGICMAVGTIFGLAPAWSAAKLEPIDALRYE